jgi:hypothetical protein
MRTQRTAPLLLLGSALLFGGASSRAESVPAAAAAAKGSPAQNVQRGRLRFDPNAAMATYPGFRMLADGSSQLWLTLSRSVDVSMRREKNRVIYVLPGVNVGVRNNTNPLVTTHFATPLERAALKPGRKAAELVLELRENVQPAHQSVAGPRGTMTLLVTLPRPSRAHAPPPATPRPAPGGATEPRREPAPSVPNAPRGGQAGPDP